MAEVLSCEVCGDPRTSACMRRTGVRGMLPLRRGAGAWCARACDTAGEPFAFPGKAAPHLHSEPAP